MADRREAAARKLQKSYFDVLGLCCSSEIPRIENALKQLDGVKDVTIIIASRTVIVVHDSLLVSPSQIVNALNQERLEANIKVNGGSHHQNKWPSPYAVASGALLIISFFKYFYHPLRWFALGAVAAGIFPVARKGLAAIRSCRIDINVLVLIAVGGTIAMKDYWEAGTIVFLFTIAEWLESRASYKASAEMSSLMSIAPQKAVIAETGEVVDVDEVKLNTVVAVKAGEVIPIDGIVVDGRSEVDEKTLTGESFPVSKQKDSIVLAGTINLNGYISVKTTALAEECVVSKMAKLVEEAQNKKSRTQRIIDKWTKFYTPAIVGTAIGLAVIPVILQAHDRSYWFHLALVVLVSACPCALVLSTPVATFCALTKAAKSGVLIKGGDYLETLGGIRCVAFDKTGTITKGEFVVADFQSLSGDISLETLLYWVSSIESKSNHPLAAPLVQYAKSRGIEPKPEDVQEFQNFPGEGICGKIDGKDIFVGNKKIAIKAGGEIAPSSKGKTEGGKTVGYVFAGATLVGTFSLSDECRSGVIQAVKELKSIKIKTAMLTGDNQEAAFHAQNQIDNALDLVHAELLPEDKSKIIETLKKDGLTIMVGDGINDAPALATADIGISMGISGSALAVETGHVVLMSNDIRKIPQVIRLARRARWTVIQNVILSIATKVAILGLAIAGHPLIWAAVIADVGTCLVVISNSMLLLRGQHKHDHDDHDHGHCHGHGHGKNHESSHAPKENKCCSKSIVSSQKHQHCGDGDLLHGSKHCGKGNKCNSGNTQHSNHSHHHHCKPESRAEKVSCESRSCSLKEKCAPKKASSELGNCTSHERCTQTCHSIQTKDVSSSAKKQECYSGISKLCGTKQCEAGLSDNVSHLIEMCDEKHGCLVGDTSNGSHTHDIQETVARQDEKNFHSHKEHGIHRSQCVSKHSECLNTSAHTGHCHQSHDCGENHRRSSGDCSELDNTEIGIESGHPVYLQTTSAHACCSLEKREIGGCCKSYMEECCGKHHGQLGHGFGGNLTEIVIE